MFRFFLPQRVQKALDRRTLFAALNEPKYTFRKLTTLQKLFGGSVDRVYLIDRLNEIGARPSKKDNEKWGLPDRIKAANKARREARQTAGNSYGGRGY